MVALWSHLFPVPKTAVMLLHLLLPTLISKLIFQWSQQYTFAEDVKDIFLKASFRKSFLLHKFNKNLWKKKQLLNFTSFYHKCYSVLKNWSNKTSEIGLDRKQLNMCRNNKIWLNYSLSFCLFLVIFPTINTPFFKKQFHMWQGVNQCEEH